MAEWFVSTLWYVEYYQFGIPIYTKSYPFDGAAEESIREATLEKALKEGLTPSLAFKEISPGVFAFREKYFEFFRIFYPPILHG